MGHVGDAAHREDHAGAVGDVADQDQLGLGRHRAFDAVIEIVRAHHRHREGHRHQLDAVAPLPLAEGHQHARIILVGGQDLVAGLEVDAVLHDLVGLAGVAGDRHFLGVAARHLGQVLAHPLDLGIEHIDHGLDRAHVGIGEIAAHRVLHRDRRGTDIAIVEIDDVAIDGEGVADIGPVILVPRHLLGRAPAYCGGSGGGAFGGLGLKSHQRDGARGDLHHLSAVHEIPL